ncbi:MAG: hypothetical protein KGP12_09310 [Actinomycetales bacterium]|jgi:hypothetical protein|nr:hypothetical protein [Actinomycetales bacterium]
MRTTRLTLIGLGATAALLVTSACSGTQSDAPASAVQDDAFSNFFDNNQYGENGLAIITTGYPDVIVGCSGTVGQNPVLITNTTDQDQTVTVTVNSELGNDVFIGSATEIAGVQGCGAFSGNVNNLEITVPAGQTFLGGVVAAGNDGPDTNLMESQHNLSIGGGDNNQWYDFWLHVGMGGGYENWELNYSNTGGTDPSQNLQAGLFNVMECSQGPAPSASAGTTGTQTFTVSSTIVSNYASNAPNAWTYNNGDPICFAFLNPS